MMASNEFERQKEKTEKKLDIRPLMDIKEKRATSFEKTKSVRISYDCSTCASTKLGRMSSPSTALLTNLSGKEKRTLALLVFHHFPVVFETIRYVWPRSPIEDLGE